MKWLGAAACLLCGLYFELNVAARAMSDSPVDNGMTAVYFAGGAVLLIVGVGIVVRGIVDMFE